MCILQFLASPNTTNLCTYRCLSHHFPLEACLECSYTTSFMVILLKNHISHHSSKYLLFFFYLESWQTSQHFTTMRSAYLRLSFQPTFLKHPRLTKRFLSDFSRHVWDYFPMWFQLMNIQVSNMERWFSQKKESNSISSERISTVIVGY